MALPIRTTVEDIQAVCEYLAKKPTGATVGEAKAVLDARHLDSRKVSALRSWGLIDGEDRLRLTERGREAVRDRGAQQAAVLARVIKEVKPYCAVIERAAARAEGSLTATEVASHWHDHFKEEVSEKEKTLNDQAVCFFHLAAGAAFGQLVIGRRGAETRFEFDTSAVAAFAEGRLPSYNPSASAMLGDEHPSPELVVPVRGECTPESQLGQGIFIAHGKNKKALDELTKILKQFSIPYKVAVEEPNLGRPISAKIKETMQACNCAILIFTADEEFQNSDGDAVWRPSENVVYELGAAAYLYDDRVVILKEDGVEFPSNFRDIGYISFGKGQLAAKSMDVLKELIGFGIVKVST